MVYYYLFGVFLSVNCYYQCFQVSFNLKTLKVTLKLSVVDDFHNNYFTLLYGSVPQGLETTKFTNFTGWNGYWPRSRFSHLDWWCIEVKKLQTKIQNIDRFHLTIIFYFCKCQKADEKKKYRGRENLEEFNLAHRCSQAKCQLVQTSYMYIKRIELFLF